MLRTRGYAALGPTSPLAPWVFDRREPGPHDIVVDISHCGVCHSDIHQSRDEWGGAIFPMAPGHEIVGTVSRVGSDVRTWQLGDLVGVGVFVDSCRRCEACLAGEEQYCEIGMSTTYNGHEQDGTTPTYGGYSERIVVDENYVLRIPNGMSLAATAPLLCAGITTYSPIRHFGVRSGDRAGVVGLGGLGHMAVKLLKALGAETTVLSHSPGKRESALRLGADDFIETSAAGAFEPNARSFAVIIDAVSAAHDYGSYLDLLRRDGNMVLVGLPDKPSPLDAAKLTDRRRRLAGSVIGGIRETQVLLRFSAEPAGSRTGGTRETQEMLDFCAERGVTADVEMIPIQDVHEAYERMLRGDVRF